MAHAFNIDVDPDEFLDDQRQGEGKGGNRGISLKIIDDVLSNSEGLFQQEGLGDDIAEKLKQLWISKLEAFDRDKQKDYLQVYPTSSTGGTSSVVQNTHKKDVGAKRRQKGQRDGNSIIQKNEIVPVHVSDNSSSTSSVLAAPKSISLRKKARIGQVDGPNDTSDEDEDIVNDVDDGDEEDDDDCDEDQSEDTDDEVAGEEPLCSGDDMDPEDPCEVFNTENVIVCQYEKITRVRNKWKFYLKDGIMSAYGRDYVFQRATGFAEW